MATVHQGYSHGAFGQHELPVHSADDSASRQQKMLQQRQLALKRQREMSKNSYGAGVVAQLDTPLEGSPGMRHSLGWGKMLQAGIECTQTEKLSLTAPSGLVCIRVPATNDDSCPLLGVTALQSSTSSSVEALVQDMSCTPKAAATEADEHPATSPSTPSEARVPKALSTLGLSVAVQSHARDCWDLQPDVKAQEKPRGRKFWRPWGTPKRGSTAGETPVEEIKTAALDAQGEGEANRVDLSSETIVEEKRVTVMAGDGDHDRFTAMSIGRAATPWQPGDETLLEESFGSDLSSIPGLNDDDAYESGGQDDSLDCELSGGSDDENDAIDKDHDESGDSGIEQTICEWKSHDMQSTTEKKSRFNRFIPAVHAPKFWRAPKTEVTRIDVMPAIDVD